MFFSFLAYLILLWLKKTPERGFIIFWIFLLLFSEFSCPGRAWMELGTKFFFLFFGLSHPALAKNNAGKSFYNFLHFFTFFFLIFLAQVEFKRNSGLKFLSLFFGLSNPDLVKTNAGKRFYNFLYFFYYFFRNFLARVNYKWN